MIERLAAVLADCLAVTRPTGEHKGRARRRMGSEQRKHAALMRVRQVEETVPRNYAMEPLPQRERAHIGNDPFVFGKPGAA